MTKYENHEQEWREEELQRRAENKFRPCVDPRDPDYIENDDEEGNSDE